jgi:hypothetical protein
MCTGSGPRGFVLRLHRKSAHRDTSHAESSTSGRFPSHLYGFAALGALQESVTPEHVALSETLASASANPVPASSGQATAA